MATTRTNKQQLTFPAPPSYWWSLILIATQLIFIAYSWWRLPPQLPLFYSLPYGFSRLAPKLFIFIPTVLSVLTFGSYVLMFRQKTATSIYVHIQFWMMQLVLFLFTIGVAHIVLIVA